MGNIQRRKVAASAVAVERAWPSRSRSEVMLEGYMESGSDVREGVGRTKSPTYEDLDDLEGCLDLGFGDLGFGFRYDEIPELCNTLPALELCYSMSQRFLDTDADGATSDVPIAN